jgi:phosphoenolpyruvate---glycerone phosphotransferase subunit DhaM
MAVSDPAGEPGTTVRAPEPVGIVLVSHSDALARGLRELLLQIGGPSVAVAVAGGTEDGELGTSYRRIAEAITSVDKGAGVVVLTDLGSAVLTARTVLADLAGDGTHDSGRPGGTVLVDAPFVEGAVAAAVIAATGADLATVRAAAEEARDARKF